MDERDRIPPDCDDLYNIYFFMKESKRGADGKWSNYPWREHKNVLLPWRYSTEIKYPREKIKTLKRKLRAAYPRHFPAELKRKGGTYWPLVDQYEDGRELVTDEQILARILGFPVSLATKIGLARKAREELGETGRKILVLGFGYGDMSLILGEEIPGSQIVAVEKDPVKVKMFEKVLRGYRFEDGQKAKGRITAVEGDILEPESYFQHGPFDLVFIKDMLGFLTDCNWENYSGVDIRVQWRNALADISERTLRGVRQVLNPGGKLVIFDRDIGEKGQPSMSLFRLAKAIELTDPSNPLMEILEIGIVTTESDTGEAKLPNKDVPLSKEGKAAFLVCKRPN